jgi:hypothetical protein
LTKYIGFRCPIDLAEAIDRAAAAAGTDKTTAIINLVESGMIEPSDRVKIEISIDTQMLAKIDKIGRSEGSDRSTVINQLLAETAEALD